MGIWRCPVTGIGDGRAGAFCKIKITQMLLRLFLFLSIVLLYSCDKNSEKINKTEKFVVDNMDVSAALDYMIIQNEISEEKTIKQLARILDCSPSTIVRLRARDTYPTVHAQNNILSLAKDVLIDKRILEDKDPKSNATIRIFHFLKKHCVFGGIIVLCICVIVFFHFKQVIKKCHIPLTRTRRKTVDKKIFGFKIGKKIEEKTYIVGYDKNFKPLYKTIIIYVSMLIGLIGWWGYRYEHRNNIDIIDNYKIVYDPVWETEL
ncbi:MAG: helix-turn-helix domain-containing protein [Lachnospiraceae bacterium]|nr:helix-turn-helix domain-containing protein [Lachnospiraceae bacterium]